MSDVIRSDYNGDELLEARMPDAPWPLVCSWIAGARKAHAERADVPEPDALSVATVDKSGHPSVRTVLLRHVAPEGLGFYTNLESRKGSDLRRDPHVAAALTWPTLFQSIRVTGVAKQLPAHTVSEYFSSRPWGSRISAWASAQSRPVEDRSVLERAEQEYAERWPDTGLPDDVPVPPFWGGFLIRCDEVEFWAGRRSRLHDRLVYVRESAGDLNTVGAWRLERRQP
ncbi:pyridoxamine 5'-phosphate oxidase [Dermacoccaceae bacterium W4C1]